MDCLIIAGEKSGEEHVMGFLPSLKRSLPEARFWGVGGDDMRAQGVELLYQLNEFSSMGFSEVIGKIPFYFKALNVLEQEARKRGTRFAILVDFQDFNMRLAKRLHAAGVKVLYYVAPQAWAWKPFRAQVMAQNVHTLFCILPFEKDWFQKRGVRQAISVPHPIVGRYKAQLPESLSQKKNRPLSTPARLLLLPGSRRSEVALMLPPFMEAVNMVREKLPVEVGLVPSENLPLELFAPYLKNIDQTFDPHDLPRALTWADVSLATSGTVTLSCGLFGVPTVVCYRTSLFNEWVFHTFINYQGAISLTNIVHQKMLFPEITQDSVTGYNLAQKLLHWLTEPGEYARIRDELLGTQALLSSGQDPATCLAQAMQSEESAR